MYELKPDFEQVLDRFEAWWQGEVLDRPLVSFSYARPPEQRVPAPVSTHASLHDRWLDVDFAVDSATSRLTNTMFGGDALPVAYPNLGPEVFSAFYGCPLVFTETTSWSEPILEDWDSASTLALDAGNEYYQRILQITDALLEAGRDRFLVGYTDLHGGADAVAALREPQRLCIDMLERADDVRALTERVTVDFLRTYDVYHDRLQAEGQHSITWLPATCRGRMHVPSNDFSCMISQELFEDLFVPGIVQECRHMDRCIYHLDGPEALRFLDLLLDVPEIDAIQWVPGAGQDRWSDWIDVYRRVQATGKSFILYPPVAELDQVFSALRPEGAWLAVSGITDDDTARAVIDAVSHWTGPK
ncbi:MAG: hypothetical protein QF689_02225 [Candidatus Latescibacteria bacterium]|nr:hypothetical protein [Candidatus Latescibacterota bacterium]MDP7447381.1 hypothetical protein [Candidatus Latescibacterota bacterium]HJP31567.1 hypothetical protein [Candidatus Latescibacterota bacterium]